MIRTGEFANMHSQGKKGFTPVSKKRRLGGALNLSQLSEITQRLIREKKAQFDQQRVVIDLGELGFEKLLGAGTLAQPVKVKIDSCSESALKKLKDSGSEAVLPTPAK